MLQSQILSMGAVTTQPCSSMRLPYIVRKKKGPESDILTCTDSVTSTELYKDERIIIYRVNGIMAARMSGGHESLL